MAGYFDSLKGKVALVTGKVINWDNVHVQKNDKKYAVKMYKSLNPY